MDEQIILRLTRNSPPFFSGDVAGFSLAVAQRLVNENAAVPRDPEAAAKAGLIMPKVQVAVAGADKAPAGNGGATQQDPPKGDTRTHELNAKNSVELVAGIESLDELEGLFHGESKHPEFQGGRASVLKAIRERAAELKAAAEKKAADDAAAGDGQGGGGEDPPAGGATQ